MRVEHTLEIPTDPATMWDLTTDVERWPDLMPTVTSVERLDGGPLAPGRRARIDQPGLRPAVWTVTDVDPPRRFVWERRLLGSRMVATHEIETTPDGCRNRLAIEMTGPTAGLVGLLAKRRLAKVLETENRSFRAAAAARKA
jgi:carbon monoxide dehydrogenase subunit G